MKSFLSIFVSILVTAAALPTGYHKLNSRQIPVSYFPTSTNARQQILPLVQKTPYSFTEPAEKYPFIHTLGYYSGFDSTFAPTIYPGNSLSQQSALSYPLTTSPNILRTSPSIYNYPATNILAGLQAGGTGGWSYDTTPLTYTSPVPGTFPGFSQTYRPNARFPIQPTAPVFRGGVQTSYVDNDFYSYLPQTSNKPAVFPPLTFVPQRRGLF